MQYQPSNQNPYQPQQPGFDYNAYNNYNSGYSFGQSFRRINLLEIGVILISLLALIGVYTWGLLSTNAQNRDNQRRQDMSQMIQAIDLFYTNSSTVPSQRFYPKAICSADLNEVDFESTLKAHITGQRPELDPHAYIAKETFPRDEWGVYSQDFSRREVPFRCPNILPGGSQTTSYPDGSESCVFNQQRNLKKCYLYTSSTNGDTYQLAFYSETNDRFVVYKRFREEALQVSVQ